MYFEKDLEEKEGIWFVEEIGILDIRKGMWRNLVELYVKSMLVFKIVII